MKLSQDRISQINRTRTVGGTPSVYLDDGELVAILCVVCADLELQLPDETICPECSWLTQQLFYDIPIHKLRCNHVTKDLSPNERLQQALAELLQQEPDVFTYFIALTSLHVQRRKYRAILDGQSIPDLETIIPRGLLEIGGIPPDELSSWLVWRKFMYDIDNRAAQTTGYLFEPILASSIGGASFSASKSPIRRDGKGRGRQVDCIVNKDAYEFKMRVTIAASGQGRFGEELSFAKDCYLSGYRPVLLVLDPTPSVRLEDLTFEFRKYGGEAYIGDLAWEHLEDEAGKVMSHFLEKYVRSVISKIDEAHTQLLPLSLEYDANENSIQVGIGSRIFHLR